MKRFFTTLTNNHNAKTAFQKSCYYKIDFKIPENATVYQAIQKFAAYNIGCLAVTNNDKVVGVISERDYITKIALLGRSSKETKISEICTFEPNLLTAKEDDSIHLCMNKMLLKNTRHLLVLDKEQNNVVGLLSIKDLIKEVLGEKDELIQKLGNFNVGKGGFFEQS